MSLLSRLNPLGSFTVGPSATYPVLSFTEREERITPDNQTVEAELISTWTIESLAVAASEAALQTLQATLRDELARIGQTVTVTILAGTPRTLAAPGTGGSSGAQVGWPRCALDITPESSFGVIQRFRLTVESRSNIAAALPVHDWTRTESTGPEGEVTITQRGSVRVAVGSVAREWAQTNVVTPARDDAATDGLGFAVRWTLSPDASRAEYEFTAAPLPPDTWGAGAPAGVTIGQVEDRTREAREGRIERSISGFAEGPGATAFAESYRPPASGAQGLLVRAELSAPAEPSGRVTFSYETLVGVTDPNFAGLEIFGFSETISETPGGRKIQAALYDNAEARLYRGVNEPWRYTQETSMLFRGDWSAASITPRMDAENLVGSPRIRRADNAGVRSISVVHEFEYPNAQAMPAPYVVEAFS